MTDLTTFSFVQFNRKMQENSDGCNVATKCILVHNKKKKTGMIHLKIDEATPVNSSSLVTITGNTYQTHNFSTSHVSRCSQS